MSLRYAGALAPVCVMMTQHEVRNPLSLQFRISEFYQGIICSQVIQGKVHQLRRSSSHTQDIFNPLTPDDLHMSRTAPLTSKRCVLYIYSTNIGTQYFKHALYSPFFFSSKCSVFHNANLFGSCISHILYTGCAEI